LQISIALAVLVNAVYIVKQRIDKMNRPTGMDDQNIFVVSNTGFAQDMNPYYSNPIGQGIGAGATVLGLGGGLIDQINAGNA